MLPDEHSGKPECITTQYTTTRLLYEAAPAVDGWLCVVKALLVGASNVQYKRDGWCRPSSISSITSGGRSRSHNAYDATKRCQASSPRLGATGVRTSTGRG